MATGIIPNPNTNPNTNPEPQQISIHAITHIGEINDNFVISIMDIIGSLNPLPNVIRINISSGGGDVRSGITAYNYLKQLPCLVHTHNLAEVSSAAILPYLAGNIRTADEISRFFFHPATFPLNESCSYPRLQEVLSLIDGDIRRYAQIVEKELPRFCKDHVIMDVLTHSSVAVSPAYGYECGLLTPVTPA